MKKVNSDLTFFKSSKVFKPVNYFLTIDILINTFIAALLPYTGNW